MSINYVVTFRVYDPNTGSNSIIAEPLPNHPVITGKEDFFDMAYHDAQMLKRGMMIVYEQNRLANVKDDTKFIDIPVSVRIFIESIR